MNESTKTTAREFNENDWCYFAGAEAFDDGAEPLLREVAEGMVVASKCGIELVSLTPDGDPVSFAWFVPMPSQALARLIVDALPDDVVARAAALGFEAL